MHPHIGIRALDARPLAEGIAKAVDHRVLDAQRRELEALQRALLRRDVDAQRALDTEVARPVDGAHRCVEVVLVAIVEFADAPQDARGEPRPEVRAVAGVPAAGEGDAAGHRAGGDTEIRELAHQKLLEAARTGREPMEQLRLRTV